MVLLDYSNNFKIKLLISAWFEFIFSEKFLYMKEIEDSVLLTTRFLYNLPIQETECHKQNIWNDSGMRVINQEKPEKWNSSGNVFNAFLSTIFRHFPTNSY